MQSVNKLISQFGDIQSECISYLFNSYCCAFYGSQAWELGTIFLPKMYISWHKAVRKIWKVSPRCHVDLLCGINNCMYIAEQLASRFMTMYVKLVKNPNKIVAFFC
jgi:hypothetical protein